MEKKKLKFVNNSPNSNPCYAKPGDSGFDLRAWIRQDTENTKYDIEKSEYFVEIRPQEIKLIETGLQFDIPENCEIQVRPRSGYSLKVGLTVNNSPGTVDVNFTGSICVIALNPTNNTIKIYNNDRIAQAVLCPVFNEPLVDLIQVAEIEKETERGGNGFGSTGM